MENRSRSSSHIDVVPGGGLRHLFKINEVNSNPDRVSTDIIIPTIDMSMGGHLRINDDKNHRRKFVYYSSSGGERTFQIPVLEYGNATGPTSLVVDVGYNFRVLKFNGMIWIGDDAWRSANAGRQLVYYLYHNMNTVGGGGNWVEICNGVVSIGGSNPYIPFSNLGINSMSEASRNLIVPAGTSLDFGMMTNAPLAGGLSFVFPAVAGQLTVSCAISGIQVPVGAPIPSFF